MNHIKIRFSVCWTLLIYSFFVSQAFAVNILGYVEKVRIDPGNFITKAKLDTGAVSASLNAVKIEEFKKDKQVWVRFEIPSDDGPIRLERKLLRHVKIKARRGEVKKGFAKQTIPRPVVKMTLTIGDVTKEIDVNLTNRNAFNYPLLLGRKPLILFNIAVDPGLTFVSHLKLEQS